MIIEESEHDRHGVDTFFLDTGVFNFMNLEDGGKFQSNINGKSYQQLMM